MTMSDAGPGGDTAETDQATREGERQTTAMADQLTHDVAAWSAKRGKAPTRQATEPHAASPSPPATRTVRKAKPAAAAVQPESQAGKPFRMSYGGTTTAEYVQYLLDRGAR